MMLLGFYLCAFLLPGGLSLYGGKDTTDIYRLLCYQLPHEQEGAFFCITCSSAQDLLPKLSQWHSNGLCMFVCTDFCVLVSTIENHTFPLIPLVPIQQHRVGFRAFLPFPVCPPFSDSEARPPLPSCITYLLSAPRVTPPPRRAGRPLVRTSSSPAPTSGYRFPPVSAQMPPLVLTHSTAITLVCSEWEEERRQDAFIFMSVTPRDSGLPGHPRFPGPE